MDDLRSAGNTNAAPPKHFFEASRGGAYTPEHLDYLARIRNPSEGGRYPQRSVPAYVAALQRKWQSNDGSGGIQM